MWIAASSLVCNPLWIIFFGFCNNFTPFCFFAIVTWLCYPAVSVLVVDTLLGTKRLLL